jgi:hypothetical protein
LSAEQYIDEFERFKRLLETANKVIKRKKEQSNVAIGLLHLMTVYLKKDAEQVLPTWKGMMKLLEQGLDKKEITESERELIAAILLLSTEIRYREEI